MEKSNRDSIKSKKKLRQSLLALALVFAAQSTIFLQTAKAETFFDCFNPGPVLETTTEINISSIELPSTYTFTNCVYFYLRDLDGNEHSYNSGNITTTESLVEPGYTPYSYKAANSQTFTVAGPGKIEIYNPGTSLGWVSFNLIFIEGLTPATYTITSSAGANGTITPSSEVNEGETRTFTIIPNAGFQVDVVTVDGVPQGAISTYTFDNIITDHEITATFKQVSTSGLMMYARSIPELDHVDTSRVAIDTNFSTTCWQGVVNQINFNWGDSGPEGCPVDYYTDLTIGFIKAPKTGVVNFYNSSDDGFLLQIGGITVINNWIEQGEGTPNSSGSLSLIRDQIYPIKVWHHETGGGSTNRLYWNLNSDDWNTATTIPECVLATTTTYFVGATSCFSLITVTQSANGIISPNNETILNGTSKTFTITPNAGFQIAGLFIDGISVPISSTYTFNNVNQDHAITASFKATATSPRQTTAGSCSSASSSATNKSQGKGSTQNANGFCSSTGGPSKTK